MENEMRKQIDRIKNLKQVLSEQLAPNGNVSNLPKNLYEYVRTEEFKKWFGDWENNQNDSSKVIDENGEPLIVYHGTPNSFDNFKVTDKIKSGWNIRDYGIYFTNSIITAKQYSLERPDEDKEYLEWNDKLDKLKMSQDWDEWNKLYIYGKDKYKPASKSLNPKTGRIIECFLNLRNPFIKDANGKHWFTALKNNNFLSGGYDGAIFLNMIEVFNDIQNTYIVFNENQIKDVSGKK